MMLKSACRAPEYLCILAFETGKHRALSGNKVLQSGMRKAEGWRSTKSLGLGSNRIKGGGARTQRVGNGGARSGRVEEQEAEGWRSTIS